MADDDRQLNQEVWQAERAAQLMADPIMKAILEETERQLILAIKSALTPEQSYKSTIALQTFSIITNAMRSMVDSGKMAAIELERKRKWYEMHKRG